MQREYFWVINNEMFNKDLEKGEDEDEVEEEEDEEGEENDEGKGVK